MKQLILLLFLIVLPLFFIAQTTTSLEGRIIDETSQEPLAYAYITLANHPLGTVSDGEGYFKLNVPSEFKNENLVFSYIGYAKQSHSIGELQKSKPLVIQMLKDATLIKEVVIKPRKKIDAKHLLKRIYANLETNYPETPTRYTGYYRESIAENGSCISYADAVAEINYAPYTSKKYNWKDYKSETVGSMIALGNSNLFNGKTLHQGHFHYRTLAKDQAKVLDSRSCNNPKNTSMTATIEGGPMGLFSADYLKFKQAFFGNKGWKKFHYQLGEVLLKDYGYVYLLSFRTALTKELMKELEKKHVRKPFYKAARNKVLQGKIYVDKDNFAVLKFEASVVPELKKYFCSYTTMNYKHFDYKLNVEYQRKGDKYYLKYLRHEDEFILNDTVTKNITPYTAVNQFWVSDVQPRQDSLFPLKEVFANIPTNHLFDLALDYNQDYWDSYISDHPEFGIPDSIRHDFPGEKSMEELFADKHQRNDSLPAPIAQQIPASSKNHGFTRTDDYAWLKQTQHPLHNPAIKAYLDAENNYLENYFIPLRKKQRDLFNELTSWVPKEDASIPRMLDGFWYQTTISENDEHPIHLRRKDGNTQWDTLLNVNEEAKNHDYYSAGGLLVSPNTQLMLYAENTTGSDKSMVKFKNLLTGQTIPDSLQDAANVIWINDHQVLYTVQEPKTNRLFQVKLHELNTPQHQDSLLFQEDDPRFQVSISKSKSKQYIYLNVGSSKTNEIYFLPLNTKQPSLQLMSPRNGEHRYSVSDYRDQFYIVSNKKSQDLEVFTCSTTSYTTENWKPFLQPKKGSQLTEFVMFQDYMVIGEAEKMENRLKVIQKSSGKAHYIKNKEDVAILYTSYNPHFEGDTLQYTITSMKTPAETWNYNMATQEQRLVKKQNIPYYQKSRWIKNEVVWAEAKDGTKIPITLLYRPIDIHKKTPFKRLYMTSYGAYGSGSEAGFDPTIYSLIHRGFVYAIAHVRGGGELGKAWHDGGKMMNKKNTFTDFIDCAEFLIEEGYAQKGNIVAEGGSAGGLLMGSVANMRPDLFKMIVLNVPFVDVVNTMLDESLPLTTLEYEEWGNPNKKRAFNYMLSYSPYDNVVAQDYPHMLFTTGIYDSRVGYWEPAKMVAKLRKLKTDNNLLFLKTNMHGGHGGGSGRFDAYMDLAYKYALIFDIFAADILEETTPQQ